ncbi:MAG: enoyl-CoA hydratase-related protein [Acidobacteriota bacterium]
MARILVEMEGPLGIVRMDDGKANAMDEAFFLELGAALDKAQASGAKAVVLAGREGFFSGGLNVKLLPTLAPAQLKSLHETFARTLCRVFTFPIPVVAAVTGHAVAGGMILALACDRRYALEGDFRWQMNEVLVGIPLPSWVLAITQASIPPKWHAQALLHGRAFSSREAASAGFLDGLLAGVEDLVEAAKVAAAELTALNPTAYALSKARMREPLVRRALELLPQERLPGEA